MYESSFCFRIFVSRCSNWRIFITTGSNKLVRTNRCEPVEIHHCFVLSKVWKVEASGNCSAPFHPNGKMTVSHYLILFLVQTSKTLLNLSFQKKLFIRSLLKSCKHYKRSSQFKRTYTSLLYMKFFVLLFKIN